jgi:hypothetical protein
MIGFWFVASPPIASRRDSNMPRLSIVIPLLDQPLVFEDTLASVLRHQPKNSEIVVLHRGDYDDPHDLEYEGVRFLEVGPHQHWSESFLASSRELDGEVVHLLMPGTSVDEGWCDECVELFKQSDLACVAPVIVEENRPGKIVTIGLGHSRGYRPQTIGRKCQVGKHQSRAENYVGPSRWAAFYSRNFLETMASCDWPLKHDLFDLEIALCARRLGLSCQVDSECFVSLENAKLIQRELKTASGATCQQLFCKHAIPNKPPGWLSTMRLVAAEFGQSFGGRNSIRQALDRLSVSRQRAFHEFQTRFTLLTQNYRESHRRDRDSEVELDRTSRKAA